MKLGTLFKINMVIKNKSASVFFMAIDVLGIEYCFVGVTVLAIFRYCIELETNYKFVYSGIVMIHYSYTFRDVTA